MITAPVIHTADLSKSFGDTQAVRSLNLVVEAGRITGFLGRNGAGKSTTIKMLMGLIRPTGGEGIVLGRRIADGEANREARLHIAYVAEDKPLYRYMTVEQMVRFTSSFYPDWRQATAGKLLREFELPLNRKVKALSKGMRTKLALLLALSRRPELLILDEPSEGLDPVTIEQVLQLMVAQAAQGTAVFFSSHQISEVERICDQICILDKGSLLMDSSTERLRESYRRIDLVLPSIAVERDFMMRGVERIQVNGCQVTIFASRNSEDVMARARAFQAVSIAAAPVGLRDVFLETVARALV